ncbi:hypothetical protein ACSQ67_007258 [Phaseolus vulgaris]
MAPNFESDLAGLTLFCTIYQFCLIIIIMGFNHTEGSNSQTATRDFHNLTVERLRALLKAKGLSTKGKKASAFLPSLLTLIDEIKSAGGAYYSSKRCNWIKRSVVEGMPCPLNIQCKSS